ncbi:MAG: sel1 repeat family protein [Muribaculaceae bacterium]|nr:sel1 repeat family protein [Muribaculaceae bacterium]
MKKFFYFLLFLCCSITVSAQNPDSELVKKAETGDAEAQYSLSKHYLPNTETVSEDGMNWLTKAAESGHAEAQWNLGNAYKKGWYGTEKNDEKHLYWVKKLANHSDIEKNKDFIASAQYDLGELYYDGEHGVDKNISEYLKWEKKSADNGYYPAALSLGYYYKSEGDKKEAIYWFKKCMDMVWAERHEEEEHAFDQLRELGVTYHPADHVGHNH